MKQKTKEEKKVQEDFLYDDLDEETLLEIDNDIQNIWNIENNTE